MSMVSPVRRPVTPARRHLSPVAEPAKRTSKASSLPATRTRRRPRTFFAIVTASVLFGVMIAQMLLSVALESGAYEIAHLQSANKEASRSYSQMSQELDRLSSPQHLALNAEALGMLSNNTPAYLRLSDGAVLGAPTSGDGFTNLVAPDGGSLVPNSLLADVPLVTSPPVTTAAAVTSPSATTPLDSTTGAPPQSAPNGPVPLTDGLPGLATR
jgi:hypothetical protein